MNKEIKAVLSLLRRLNQSLIAEVMQILDLVEERAEDDNLSPDEAAYLSGRVDGIETALEIWNRIREGVRRECLNTSNTSTTPDTLTDSKS